MIWTHTLSIYLCLDTKTGKLYVKLGKSVGMLTLHSLAKNFERPSRCLPVIPESRLSCRDKLNPPPCLSALIRTKLFLNPTFYAELRSSALPTHSSSSRQLFCQQQSTKNIKWVNTSYSLIWIQIYQFKHYYYFVFGFFKGQIFYLSKCS